MYRSEREPENQNQYHYVKKKVLRQNFNQKYHQGMRSITHTLMVSKFTLFLLSD